MVLVVEILPPEQEGGMGGWMDAVYGEREKPRAGERTKGDAMTK